MGERHSSVGEEVKDNLPADFYDEIMAEVYGESVVVHEQSRNETVQSLLDYYGGQTLTYGTHVGTISDVIESCPFISSAIDQGSDYVISLIETHKDEHAAVRVDEDLKDEVQDLSTISLVPEQTQLVERSSEQGHSPEVISDGSDPHESAADDTFESVIKVEDEPIKIKQDKLVIIDKESSLKVDAIEAVEATIATEIETKLADTASLENELIDVTIPPAIHESLVPEVQYYNTESISTDVATYQPEAFESSRSEEKAVVSVAPRQAIAEVAVDWHPVQTYEELIVNDSVHMSKVFSESPIVEFSSLDQEEESLSVVDSFVEIQPEITYEARPFDYKLEFSASDTLEFHVETDTNNVNELPSTEIYDEREVNSAQDNNELLDFNDDLAAELIHEDDELAIVSDSQLYRSVNIELEDSLEDQLGDLPDELIDIAEELFDEFPEEEVSYKPVVLQSRVKCAVEAVQLLSCATSAEECHDSLQQLRRTLIDLLYNLGYHEPELLAKRLIQKYDMKQLYSMLVRLQQAAISHHNTLLQDFVSMEPIRHTLGRHVVGMFVNMRDALRGVESVYSRT